MRPKSPFLQNLRKRKPEPKMSKKVQDRKLRSSSPEGFNQFNVRGVTEEFVEFKMENPVVSEEVVPEEPEIDIEAERRAAHKEGYNKAKKEFEHFKNDAEILEKNFQEILLSMEEARHQWVHEVRVSVASAIQVSLSQILRSKSLQMEVLQNKLAEAMEHLTEEKKMKVVVAPEYKEFTEGILKDRPGWSVHVSTEFDGGALLESENGIWDARLSVTLNEIEHLIQTWLVEKSGS